MDEFTTEEIQAMMDELGTTRYQVRRSAHRAGNGSAGYFVVDTAHQDRVMSKVLTLHAARGWAVSELHSWALRCLRRSRGPEFPNGTPGYDAAEHDHP